MEYIFLVVLICVLGLQMYQYFQKLYSEVRYMRQLFTAPCAKIKFSEDGKTCTITIRPLDEEE